MDQRETEEAIRKLERNEDTQDEDTKRLTKEKIQQEVIFTGDCWQGN